MGRAFQTACVLLADRMPMTQNPTISSHVETHPCTDLARSYKTKLANIFASQHMAKSNWRKSGVATSVHFSRDLPSVLQTNFHHERNPDTPQVETTENGFEVHEHMWSNEVFTAYVDDIAGKGCWRERMQPRMEQIITWSLLCAQVKTTSYK